MNLHRIATSRHAAVLGLTTAFASLASAQNVFTTANTANQWGNTSNWSLGVIPNAVGADVLFNSPVGGNQSINSYGTGRTIGVFTVNNTSANELSFTSTSSLTFDNSSGNAQLNIIGTTTSITRITSPVILSDNLALNVTNINATDNRGALAMSGVVSGAGRIIKTGNGAVSVAGSTNTFEGGVEINGGTYRITAASGVGAAPAAIVANQVSINGGRLRYDNTNDATLSNTIGFTLGSSNAEIAPTNTGILTINGTITGSGALTKTGSGILNIANGNTTSNTYEGGTIVAEGTLRLGRSGSLGAGPVQLGVIGGSDASLIANLGGWTQSNDITVVAGAVGTLRLGGSSGGSFNNTFSGDITINGNVEITSATLTGFATRTTGELSGSGTVTKVGTGTWQIENANNTWNGNMVISSGAVNLSSTGSQRFTLGDAGLTNSISGTGSATFDGVFVLDRSAVTSATGSWNLVNVSTLSESFGASFALRFLDEPTLFANLGGGLYGLGDWSFNSGTGTLTLAPIPEPSAFAALAGLCSLGLAATRRQRRA